MAAGEHLSPGKSKQNDTTFSPFFLFPVFLLDCLFFFFFFFSKFCSFAKRVRGWLRSVRSVGAPSRGPDRETAHRTRQRGRARGRLARAQRSVFLEMRARQDSPKVGRANARSLSPHKFPQKNTKSERDWKIKIRLCRGKTWTGLGREPRLRTPRATPVYGRARVFWIRHTRVCFIFWNETPLSKSCWKSTGVRSLYRIVHRYCGTRRSTGNWAEVTRDASVFVSLYLCITSVLEFRKTV